MRFYKPNSIASAERSSLMKESVEVLINIFICAKLHLICHLSGEIRSTCAQVTTSAQKEAANTMGGVLRVAANS